MSIKVDGCDSLEVLQDEAFRCQYCFRPFDPISTRHLCPYDDCKMKNTCCE